ncbi:HPP family protein [Sphingomonas sp. RHCKR47]|uniref:HPP family protein n=1 Tax=Sphingomonas citricola TaxID=2862498 RepID=UPI001CA58E23|nr:HPP family protein [Sphingomonas citricola]MBW6523173.1 HPP family protein [Sphingomonas citricola]
MLSFKPMLAGAHLGDRMIAAGGALVGIALTAALCTALLPHGPALLLVAPMGASAVLVFAVPASPLAQPWPVIGGNMLSALVGIAVARVVPQPAIAAGVAVGASIAVMSLTRSLHPPGGAASLLAVLGWSAVQAQGWAFAFVPVAANAVVLAATGVLFHRLSGHSYPHRAVPAAGHTPATTGVPHPEDIDRALEDLGETFDVSRDDLDLLFRTVAAHAARRG